MTAYTFNDAATRDARLTNPQRGDTVYLLSTGESLVYHGSVYRWKPPWSLPWGTVGSAVMPWFVPYSVGTFPNLNPVGAVGATFAALPNRVYLVEIQACVRSGADGDLIDVRAVPYPGGSAATASGASSPLAFGLTAKVQMTGTSFTPAFMRYRFGAPGSDDAQPLPVGDTVFYLLGGQITGTGGTFESDGNGDTYIRIYDDGPNGSPRTS